ncbi:MAG: hypothetical protein LUH03_04465 [Oscillospiraceae bacterium]|nr:hypothetical protein [Oscillospiraceae bacterium]
MAYSDMVVKDAEFETASKNFAAYHETLLSAIQDYRFIISDLSVSAVSSGSTHDALLLFIEYVSDLEDVVEDLSGRFETIVNNFISDLETEDDYLYDSSISDVSRDFSQELYEHLVECLDDPWCAITDSFGDKLYEIVLKILGFFDLDGVKASLNSCHTLLLDYNDETKSGLTQMFDAVHQLDLDYGRSLTGGGDEDYYTCYFGYISLTMCSIRDMINEMADIIKPGSNAFTVKAIQDRLGSAYQELLNYYDKVVEISELKENPTIEEIADFASEIWARSFFNDFNEPISNYLANIGGLDSAQMVFFNMFGIAEGTLLSSINYDTILNFSSLSGKAAYTNNYDVYLIKEQLLSALQDMSENYEYSGSDEQKAISNCQIFLKYIEKFGEDWYDKLREDGLLDGRTKEAKQFKSFLNDCGGLRDVLKYGSASLEYLARAFADYSAGLEMLESFQRCYSGGNETLIKAVEQVQELYGKEFGAWVQEAFEEGLDIGFDALIKAASEASPVVAVISAIDKGISVAGEYTGLGPEAESMYNSLVYYNLYTASYSAYGEALENFRLQVPGTEEYEQAAKDLENCFNFHKKNIEAMYEAMAEASNGVEKSYYEYCAKRASLLTMKSDSSAEIMSFEEFCALGS